MNCNIKADLEAMAEMCQKSLGYVSIKEPVEVLMTRATFEAVTAHEGYRRQAVEFEDGKRTPEEVFRLVCGYIPILPSD